MPLLSGNSEDPTASFLMFYDVYTLGLYFFFFYDFYGVSFFPHTFFFLSALFVGLKGLGTLISFSANLTALLDFDLSKFLPLSGFLIISLLRYF
jgi:hypothetical protein